MNYRLRRAVPSDAKRIEALFIEMLRTIYQKEDVTGYEAGYLDRFFCGTGDWICVAESGGRVVAFLSMEEHREAADYIYLDDFSVEEAYRNQGIGTALLGVARQYAGDREIPEIILHVEKTNARAHALYERIGFEDCADEGERVRMRYHLQCHFI